MRHARYGWFGTASIVDAADQGGGTYGPEYRPDLLSGTGNQGYVDVAPPPPPPPQVSTSSDWSNPYGAGGGQVAVSAPPLVSVPASSSSSFDWLGAGQKVVTGLVDIFGRPVTPTGQVVQQQQPGGIPLAAWVAIGVAGVVVLGVAARALRSRRPSYAGHKRRKHRR